MTESAIKPFKKPKTFNVDVYDIEVDVFDSMELAQKWLREEYVQTLQTRGSAEVADFVNGAAGFCAMVIKEDPKTNQMFSVICICIPPNENRGALLCHEVSHAAHMILESRGVPMSLDTTEAIAYLEGYIFKESAIALGMQS